MAMTIKNEHVVEKIRALAQDIGTDQVRAVEVAVDEMRASLAGRASVLESRLAEVLGLAEEIRVLLPSNEVISSEHATDSLYDEKGLPA